MKCIINTQKSIFKYKYAVVKFFNGSGNQPDKFNTLNLVLYRGSNECKDDELQNSCLTTIGIVIALTLFCYVYHYVIVRKS
ncbi:hypothetical protein PUN28_011704 [Cardiocondyla obscurior]|uniref:Uncharacterized protein n=1 Tax=Cardiocondyla obscurior TaxID=286306 RepID=A0AAW2FK92_9HYME